MTEPELVARLGEIEQLHRRVEADEPGCDDFCGWDYQDWPCDTAELIAAVRAVLTLADELDAEGRSLPPGGGTVVDTTACERIMTGARLREALVGCLDPQSETPVEVVEGEIAGTILTLPVRRILNATLDGDL